MAEGLAAAHNRGLIHRDIKPANIWLEERLKGQPPRVRILDFGLARAQSEGGQLTSSGAVVGTAAYMPPEQARGKQVDCRSDLFSLGVVLYEMSTGQRPFTGPDVMAILSSLALDTPEAPQRLNAAVPDALSDLIMRLLDKDSAKRPYSADAVADELNSIAQKMAMPIVMPLVVGPEPKAANPWAGIYDSDSGDSKPMKRADPAKATPGKVGARFKRTSIGASQHRFDAKIWIAIAVGILFIGGGSFAAYKLFIEPKNGTLLVEVDGDADVRFKNGELHIF